VKEDGWLTVVIPAYNEKLRIYPTLREVEVFHRKYPNVVKKVVVVDDGSKDNTVEVALRATANMDAEIIALKENSGKWAAIHAGIAFAKTDALLILDADGSAQISELRKMSPAYLKEIRKERVCVFGSRFSKGSSVEGKSLVRGVISQGYRAYVLLMYWFATKRTDVNDMQCPWKLVWKSQIHGEWLEENRFCGDLELACSIKGRIENYPVQFIHMAGSKIKTETIWEMFKGTWRVAKRFRKIETEE